MPTTEPAVRQIVQLPGSGPWPTVDPFLFCVHHLDRYPAGDGRLAPAASLHGRSIGHDFSGLDGWSMYHGSSVPGFPAHPHRGFETVTFVQRGLVDHSDSMGATARYGAGDVQWLTAGEGIVHAEMFPLVHDDRPNPTELFQVWLNLPAASKMARPHFSMLWAEDVPRVRMAGGSGPAVEVTVVAGAFDGTAPPPPPPDSWASQPGSDVAIWHLAFEPGASLELPAAAEGSVRALYVLHAGPDEPPASVLLDGEPVASGHVAVVAADRPVRAEADGAARVLVLQGRPIGEPVAQYGPFVMNDEAGIQQAFEDYRRTGFGGWPWAADDPDHGVGQGRFARRPDGTVEEPRPA